MIKLPLKQTTHKHAVCLVQKVGACRLVQKGLWPRTNKQERQIFHLTLPELFHFKPQYGILGWHIRIFYVPVESPFL